MEKSVPTFHEHKGILLFLAGAGLFILAFLYVLQINAVTGAVYLLGDLEKTFKELRTNIQGLQTGKEIHLSHQRMEELAKMLNFERVSEITYLEILGESVAQRSLLQE